MSSLNVCSISFCTFQSIATFEIQSLKANLKEEEKKVSQKSHLTTEDCPHIMKARGHRVS